MATYHGWLLRSLILPAGDAAFGQSMMSRLRLLEKVQWWDPERLAARRDRAVEALIRTAYEEVPFYRDLMDGVRLRPSDIRRRGDLHKLPVITKDRLRSGYPHRTTRRTGYRTTVARTSGSTGTNFSVLTDTETTGWWRASLLLAFEWAGWHIGEPHLQLGMNLSRKGDRRWKDWLLRCHYASSYDLTDRHLDTILDLVERRRIRHLWGYPGGVYMLARRARQLGWNIPMSSAVTWGDNLFGHYRSTIEAAFRTRVFDTYGCAEGMQIAAQCGHLQTYHVHTLDIVVDYVDSHGQPVSPGESGDVVLTRLQPGPMPLIRYRVGDRARAPRTPGCSCGRGYETMEAIEGRDTDVVITPSGNRLIVHFFTGILEHFPDIASFQVVQEELNKLFLKIVPARELSRQFLSGVVAALRRCGADIDIEVELVSEIPLTAAGKRRFVISRLARRLLQTDNHDTANQHAADRLGRCALPQ